jgi:GT2 family glycosyltransferase/glycosyltransferase involved in cell wall biosynthesis
MAIPTAKTALLAAETEPEQLDAHEWRLQYLINHSFVRSLFRSPAWRLLRPLRAARELLRPRGFDSNDLIAWHDLEPDREAPAGTWVATGPSPYFIVPCVLPPGWLRFRLRMSTEVAGRLELFDIGGNGIGDFDCLKQIDVRGEMQRDEYVYLRRTALGLRLHPLNTTGRFRLEELQVMPLHRFAAPLHAFRNKLAALRRYGLVKRALRNGLGLLLRGHPIEFLGKLHDGLHWPRSARGTERGARSAEKEESYGPTNSPRMLDIVYVLKSAGLCGGVRVISEHVARLRARGYKVAIYYLAGELDAFHPKIPAIHFESPEALKAALGRFRGIKVATWYETAAWVADSLQPGDRGYYLVQDIEECYGATAAEKEAVRASYQLGLRPITEGVWVRDQLKQIFGRDSVFVGIGLDCDIFHPLSVDREPQRILTQARSWSGGGAAGARLKDWETARKTVLRCFEINPRATLTTFSIEGRPECPAQLPHSHYQAPSDRLLAKLYSQAGVYLLTSTHEGFGLTAAEAMACGCPVVATYAQGNEEFCIDGYTALMAPAGDVGQLARHCLRLQSDRSFAAKLADHGRRFIREYTWDRVIDRLEREFFGNNRPASRVEQAPAETGGQAGFSKEREVFGPSLPDRRGFRAANREEAHSADAEYPDLQLSEDASLDCTVVIPTLNHVDLVVQAVTSCRRFLPPKAEVEFVVVDDGTRDPTILDELRQKSRELGFELLYNHQNLGFSATVNHGVRHARGRYVLLCNNDIVFFQPWLEAIDKAFGADPELGILGAKLLFPNGSVQHAGVDKVPGLLRWHHTYHGWPGDHPRVNHSRYVWSVTGALFTVRREALRRLGGLSTAYATAYEDLDYCLHAWSRGVRVGYCAELAAYHQEGKTRGATTGQKQSRPLFWSERERAGSLYFEKKWAALRQVEDFEALLPQARSQKICTKTAARRHY